MATWEYPFCFNALNMFSSCIIYALQLVPCFVSTRRITELFVVNAAPVPHAVYDAVLSNCHKAYAIVRFD